MKVIKLIALLFLTQCIYAQKKSDERFKKEKSKVIEVVDVSTFINYETGEVSKDELVGTVINVITPRKILFKETETGEKITIRLAYMDFPNKGEFYYEKGLAFIKERILNKEIEVSLFNFNPKKSSCPAAFVEYTYETSRTKGIDTGRVKIGNIVFTEKRYLNEDLLEGGFAKAIPQTTLSSLINAVKEAKGYKIGVWSK